MCTILLFVEFLDEIQVKASNSFSHLNYPVSPMLFFEFQSASATDAQQQAELVGEPFWYNCE